MVAARKTFGELDSAVDRRSAPRATPATILHATFGDQHGGVILDLSEGGFAVATALVLLDRVVPYVRIPIGPGKESILVSGRTIWTAENTQRAGLEFIGISESQQEQIREWAKRQIPATENRYEEEIVETFSPSNPVAPESLELEIIDWPAKTTEIVSGQTSGDEQTLAHLLEGNYPGPTVAELVPVEFLPSLTSSLPEAAWNSRSQRQSIPRRMLLYVAMAFLAGAVGTFATATTWSSHRTGKTRNIASGPRRGLPATQDSAWTGAANSDSRFVAASAEQNAAEDTAHTVLILPAAIDSPYRASLLKEELPGPASTRIISQRSLFLPEGALNPADGKSISAKSLVPGKLLTELVPDFVPQPGDLPAEPLRVRAHVGADGKVLAAVAISGPTALMTELLSAVGKWRYEPTLLDGRPVETQVDLTLQLVFNEQ